MDHPHISKVNARQFLQQHLGPFPEIHLAQVEECMTDHPQEPNVYTDGSVTCPRIPAFSLGGLGVWWPWRDIRHHKLTSNENDLGHICVRSRGFELTSGIQGPCTNSTRAETLAGLAAICAPGPMHIGSDSKAFVDQANNIINDESWSPPKPWPLCTDGDIWPHFQTAVRQKGRHAIKVTKVLGHATSADIDMGLATVIHKEHNDYADKLADSGVKLHTDCMVALSSLYARRVTLMECVVCHIHRHITSTLQAHNQARERKRKPAYLLTHPQVKSTITVPLTLAVTHHDTGHALSPHDPKLLGHDDPTTLRCKYGASFPCSSFAEQMNTSRALHGSNSSSSFS